MDELMRCPSCRQAKPREAFDADSRTTSGHRYTCAECTFLDRWHRFVASLRPKERVVLASLMEAAIKEGITDV